MKPFKVIFGDLVTYKFKELDEDDGEYYPDERLITLNNLLEGDALKHAKLHEEFHAVWEILGFHCANIPDELEEVIIENMSKFVTTFYNIEEKD